MYKVLLLSSLRPLISASHIYIISSTAEQSTKIMYTSKPLHQQQKNFVELNNELYLLLENLILKTSARAAELPIDWT